jgi:hypothetical protein
MWKNLPVEFLNGRFRHVYSVWLGVVMLKNHSMPSTWGGFLNCFLQMAKLLTIAFSIDGQVSLKQFHIPRDAQHGCPEGGVSLISKSPWLKPENHFWAVLSAIESSQ